MVPPQDDLNVRVAVQKNVALFTRVARAAKAMPFREGCVESMKSNSMLGMRPAMKG